MNIEKSIPNHYNNKRLGDHCDIILGQSPPSDTYNSEGIGLPFFQGKAEFGDLHPVAIKWCSLPGKIALPNDILISVRAPVGSTNIADHKCCIGRGLAAIRHKNYKYVYYFLKSIETKINELGTGTTFKAITGNTLKDIIIPVPPDNEQNLIVEKIEELFSELDAGRRQLEVVKKQLVTYRQSVLKFAFEGKFTKTKFVESKTGNIVDIINNGYTPSREFLSEDFGDIPFIKVYNLNFNGTLNFRKNPTFIPKDIHKKQLKRSICLPGDVLINIVGPPLGKVSIVTDQFPEWNINQAVVMFRPNEKVLSKYLSYFLQNSATINWLEDTSKATAGQWNVKVSTCREIPIPICSPVEQEIVVNEIESRLSVCDKLEQTIETCLQQSEALKQSILKQAFEGNLIKSPINC